MGFVRLRVDPRPARTVSHRAAAIHVARATLFWDGKGLDRVSIAAGTLDAPTGLKTVMQIYARHAGDYYEIPADIPRRDD